VDHCVFPEKLELDGTYQRLLALLYEVFKQDFILRRPFYRGLPVVFDNNKIGSDYEEGFWHVITSGKTERELDYKRAKRLPWLRFIIEHYSDPDILCWQEEDLDNRRGQMVKKHFCWYEKGEYLVILKERPGKYFLATAFHVTGAHEHDRFMKKYLDKKKGTGS
jgi:hypothetical protein